MKQTHDCFEHLKKWINYNRQVTAYTCQICKKVWTEDIVEFERVKRQKEPGEMLKGPSDE